MGVIVYGFPVLSQGCFDAEPFCSDEGYNFPNVTGTGQAPAGPNYNGPGCFGSQPNAAWYYLKIADSGTLQIQIAQTSTSGFGADVDFTMWGPFDNMEEGCQEVMGGAAPIQFSYSAASTETIGIGMQGGGTLTCSGVTTPPPAVSGDYYVVMITNYSGNPGNISLTQTGGTGSTDCNIVECDIQFAYEAEKDTCGAGLGSFTLDLSNLNGEIEYEWTGGFEEEGVLNDSTFSYSDLEPGDYTIHVEDTNECQGSKTITIDNFEPNYSTESTVVSCSEGNDGTATVYMEPEIGNVSYLWNDPNGQTTQTASGLAEGEYEVEVTSSLGCTKTVSVTVDVIPPMEVNTLNQEDVTCNSGEDGVVEVDVENGKAPYSFVWSKSNSTTNLADDLPAGETELTITDDNGCVHTEVFDVGEPNPIEIIEMTSDTVICLEDSVSLYVESTGGSSAYTYEWKANGQVLGNTQTIIVNPTQLPMTICVTVGEECGSHTAEQCMTLDHPNDVDINLSPSTVGDCYPVEVELVNTTNTDEEIDYTVWTYSDGDIDTVVGDNSVSHLFGEGVHDVHMEIVTERGCKYEKMFPYLIEGYPYPEADFYVNPNPVSMFEPTVDAFNQSTNDVISTKWFAEDAEPSYSSLTNPSFRYPSEEGNHDLLLVVENEYGCIDSIQKVVQVKNEVTLFAPNTFTPDNDGYNDRWRVHISGVDIYDYHLQIYNYWGTLIFESFDPEGEWDGTYGGEGRTVPDGTYIWKIRAADIITDEKYEFQGFVNLLR